MFDGTQFRPRLLERGPEVVPLPPRLVALGLKEGERCITITNPLAQGPDLKGKFLVPDRQPRQLVAKCPDLLQHGIERD
jgi:hypothetical protein